MSDGFELPGTILGSRIDELIELRGDELSEQQRRRFALFYATRWNDLSGFERMETPLAFLQLQIDGTTPDEVMRAEAVDLLEECLGETCLSMNEIAAAVEPLFSSRPFGTPELRQSLVHVWDAFACVLPRDEYRPREDAYLCEQFESALAAAEV